MSTLTTPTTNAAPTTEVRGRKQRIRTPYEAGLPDPRPVTDYTATVSVVSGKTRITIQLGQPCAIRSPSWSFVSCVDGSRVAPVGLTIVDNRTFYFDFAGLLDPAVCFVDVPCQDTQVQNGQGGFVRSGGQWFRKAVLPP